MGFWRNKIKTLHSKTAEDLEKQLNAFFSDKFVIATQIFFQREEWVAFVYFKVKEDIIKNV